MEENSWGNWLALLVFLAFYLITRKPKKEKKPAPPPVLPHKAKKQKPVLPQKESPLFSAAPDAPVYEVEKKKENPVISSLWRKKGSLRQAVLLSEILKGPYDRR